MKFLLWVLFWWSLAWMRAMGVPGARDSKLARAQIDDDGLGISPSSACKGLMMLARVCLMHMSIKTLTSGTFLVVACLASVPVRAGLKRAKIQE